MGWMLAFSPSSVIAALASVIIFPAVVVSADIVSFPSGKVTLQGVLYKPEGTGPFPAVLYNHGSGNDYSKQFDALGPVFTKRGWLFFAPYRRGQGLSASAGQSQIKEIEDASKAGGRRGSPERFAVMFRILTNEHVEDQFAAFAWLTKSGLVDTRRVAVAGNSFGGIQAVIGAERGSYCAAINSAGAAQNWSRSPTTVQDFMTRSVRNAKVPIFFFQAENDWDVTPSRALAAVAESAGKRYQLKIYPAFGTTKEDGHAFGYFGSSVWADDVFKFLDEHCPK